MSFSVDARVYSKAYQIVSGHGDQLESQTGSEDDGKDEGECAESQVFELLFIESCLVLLPMDHRGMGCKEKLILDNVRLSYM